MTTTSPAGKHWPTQLRLPGQTAAPEGPVDMLMMYVMHHAFRRDLRRFADAVRGTPVDDRTTWRLLHERWQIFAEVLHRHHTVEDTVIWPWLRSRVSDEGRATLDAMESEHEEIDPLLESCTAGFARLAETADPDARAALAVRVVAARDSLARHLEHEETEAITLIQSVMSAGEWRRLDEEKIQEKLPLRYVAQVVPWAAYDLPRPALQRAFAEAGRGFWLVWLVTRRRFARRERRAFAHA